MIGFVLRRLLAMLGVLIAVSIITFLMFIVVPGGDPAVRLAGRTPTEQNIQNIRTEWGFDKPVYVQYATLMRRTVDGSLTSYVNHTNVQKEILRRLPVTITIACGALLLWIVFGTLIGVLSALWAGTARDRFIAGMAMAGLSLPIFWAAIEVRYLLSYKLHLLPDGGYVSFFDNPWSWFTHLILPCTMTAIAVMAIYSRVLRNTILDVVREDYVKTARAKGLPARTVWTHHVLRNALLPAVTLLGLDFAAVLGGGTILIETVFDMHGVGQYAAQAVGAVDLPPLMAVTLYGAAVVVVINALVDLLYGLIDPRARAQRMTAPLLSVRDLQLTFAADGRSAPVVRGVDLDVGAGEIVALVGESGSGKSSVVNALAGLADPSAQVSGTVELLGTDLLSLSSDELRRRRGCEIGLVFQNPMSALNPCYRILRQVAEAVLAHRQISRSAAEERALDLLAEVRLPQPEVVARRYPHELSGGMCQRVMIAIALACDPPLILADEPTTALDATVQAQILDLLADLREHRGMAVLLVSHDLGVVGELAQRILVMYAGQIVESGTTEAVLSDPRHPYTRLLLAASPRLDLPRRARQATIPGNAAAPGDVPEGCAFRSRCPLALPACAAPQELVASATEADHRDRCMRAEETHGKPIGRSVPA